MRVRELLLCGLMVAAACRAPHEDLLERVELAGCREVLAGPVCEIEEPTSLRLFVKAPKDAQLRVLADSDVREVTWARAGDGLIAELSVGTATRTIALEARRQGTDRWDRSIAVWKRPPPLREASAALRHGKVAEAAAIAAKTSTTGDARSDGELEKLRAVLAMNRGDGPAALLHWTRSAELARRAGVISKELNDRLAIVHGAIFSARDLELARSMLDALDPAAIDVDPRGAANLAHYRGVLAFQTGDFRGALSAFERAELSAARFDIPLTSWSSKLERAEALIALGAYDRALQVLAEVREHPVTKSDPCSEANLLGREAWAGLMAREAGQRTSVDLRKTIARGLELVRGPCASPAALQDWLTNLVVAATQDEDFATARATIAQVKESALSPLNALWVHDSEARIALAERSFVDAHAAYAAMSAIKSHEAAWRACVGRAAVFRAEGRVVEALQEHQNAEKMLDEQSLAVSVLSGRSRFLNTRDTAVGRHIELLLETNQERDAIAVMRRARARAIAGLQKELRVASFEGEARRRWERAISRYTAVREKLDQHLADEWTAAKSRAEERAAERRAIDAELKTALEEVLVLLDPRGEKSELAAPERDEVVLGFMRVGDRWIGFAVTSETQRVAVIAGEAWLAPFAEILRAKPRVRVLVGGDLGHVDFHALLADTHEVRYALDVPHAAGVSASSTMLVVADPHGDLPNARDEARSVAGSLSDRTVLLGREATREQVIERLARAGTFHYAGHGKFAGEDGWESALPLASAAELNIGDILALEKVPPRVVLSGCETAETSALAGQTIGLAQAFVLAGAQEVVASTRPVKDETAKQVAEQLHRVPGEPLSAALRRAQRELKAREPSADWAAFRVIVP